MVLFYNGKVLTDDGFKEAVLIDEGIFKEIATSDELLQKYPDSLKIDLNKKLVSSGFNDSHMHLLNYGFVKKQLKLYDARSVDEVICLGKDFLNTNRDLIIGRGYNDAIFTEKRPLTRDDLDQISKDIPVILYRICGHIVSVNSKVLEIANINSNIKIEGGSIDVDENQRTIGILRENAMGLLEGLFTQPTKEEIKQTIVDAIKDANQVGLTSVSTNDIHNDIEFGKTVIEAYQELYQEGRLNLRINHQVTFDSVRDLDEFLNQSRINSPYVRVGALKIFIDGSLGAKTAYMKENYLNENHNGILCMDQENLDNLVTYANFNNLPVVIHAIGDKGIEVCLNAFEKVTKGNNILRHGIIHVQITDKNLLERFKNLQISALVQPIFINNDMEIIDSRVKKELAITSYAFKTLLDTTLTCFGSDAPVEDFNPMLSIYSSVTRANLKYNHVFNPDQKTTVKEAIRAYTINSAFMSFEENNKGLIKEGFYADMVVMDDIFTIDEKNIKDAKVYMTVVGGKIVYQKGE